MWCDSFFKPPPGFKRIRHYGLLAPAHKAQRLSAARQALNAPAPNPLAQESAEQFMQRVAQRDIVRCPCCGKGRLQRVEVLLPQGRTEPRQIPGITLPCNNRGPP